MHVDRACKLWRRDQDSNSNYLFTQTCKRPCLRDGYCVCARSRAATLNKDKVKLLSPHNRLVIALHSPGGTVETGLPVCPPEKELESWREELRTRFSPVRFGSRNRRNCGHFRRLSKQCRQIS